VTLPRLRSFRNWGARVHEHARAGLDGLALENAALRVGVLTGRGADVVEFNYKPRDMDFVTLWGEGIPPAGEPAASDTGTAFLDLYRGGWQEIFPNGGPPSRHAGAEYAQHGEVTRLAWDVELLDDREEHVAVRLRTRLRRAPLELERTLRLDAGAAVLDVAGRAINLSPVPVDVMWGHHLAFGPPFLSEDCRIELPDGALVTPHATPIAPGGRRVAAGPHRWPAATAPDGAELDLRRVPARAEPSELLYVSELAEGRYSLVDDRRGLALRVEWDLERFPFLWIWQENGATTEYPWYGQRYVLGLEPFSSMPSEGLAAAVAGRTALTLAPHGVAESWLRIGIAEVGT
jgi:galactose mutarotase-like enzyme